MPTLCLKSLIFFIFLKSSLCLDITEDVFGNITNHYLPAAFGDFNADKLTDMFIIEKQNGGYNIKVLLSYSVAPFVRSNGPQCEFHRNVVSLVPSDFDGDGAMDVLVVSFKEELYDCFVLWGNLKNLSCLQDFSLPLFSLKSQPVLLDYNGDMISDIFGEGSDGKRSFWIFSSTRRKPIRVPMEVSDDIIKPLSPLKKSGGHGFVDLDKDLAADLWLSASGHFEFWPSSLDFQNCEIIEHPKINGKEAEIIGQSSFMDIDMDGEIEVLIPVCSDSSCSQSFFMVYEFGNMTYNWYNLKVNLMDEDEIQWSFPSNKASYLYTNTITARVGDQNFDGFPDILITLFNGNTPKVILLINTECKIDCEHSRTFTPMWKTFDDFSYSVLGTFFDFFEDGNLDVLLVNSTLGGESYSLRAYKDPVGYDAMFLKVMVITGVCYNDCPYKQIPYGTNLPGPSITYTMTSADGGIQKAFANQMSQTGYFALQLPFTVFGLGRNWNFIDKLYVGIPLTRPVIRNIFGNKTTISVAPLSPNEVLYATFSQIIPNSQLVIIPYPINSPSNWITKLFITPSKAMLMTAGALIATCLFVAGIIGVLHFREKQQDKQERRQQAQRFHFDAM
ncbi:UNVERIFIED_CONTAM: hypothetical protein RMT77_005033 [Armadillidium vulgare]|nr:T-cell immunomodulatory protein [Armadillidium vulgare]